MSGTKPTEHLSNPLCKQGNLSKVIALKGSLLRQVAFVVVWLTTYVCLKGVNVTNPIAMQRNFILPLHVMGKGGLRQSVNSKEKPRESHHITQETQDLT